MAATSKGESRDGVALTNLDQPLFDGAEATKRDLVDYLDGVARPDHPRLEDRPLSVIRVHRGQEAFMQKNVPEVHARLGADGGVLGGGVEARGRLRAVQRPAHAAVVRQPAGGRVPPDARAGRATRPGRPTSCSTSTRPRATRSRMAVRGRAPRAAGARRRRAGAARSRRAAPRACTCSCPIDDASPIEDVGRRHPGHRGAGRARSTPTSPPPRS